MKSVIEFAGDVFCAATRLEKTTSGHRTIVKDYPDAKDSLTALIEDRDAEIHAMYAPAVEALGFFLHHGFSEVYVGRRMFKLRLLIEPERLTKFRSALAAIKEIQND